MEYTTVRAPAEDSFVERKSRFIGKIAPVENEEQALDFLGKVREANREAAHNVYAYLLRSGVTRCSDDGEPQGTGGVPVLEVIQRSGLTDICVVVTRYFGGILLGAGGLTRAYSHGAALAVKKAERRILCECAELEMDADYTLYGKISYLLPRAGAKVLDSGFGAAVHLRVLIRAEKKDMLAAQLRELSGGAVQPYVTREGFYDPPDPS